MTKLAKHNLVRWSKKPDALIMVDAVFEDRGVAECLVDVPEWSGSVRETIPVDELELLPGMGIVAEITRERINPDGTTTVTMEIGAAVDQKRDDERWGRSS